MIFYRFISLELFILASSIPFKELSKDNMVVRSSQLERKAFDSAVFEIGAQLEHGGKLDKRDIYQFNNPGVGGIHFPLKMANAPLLRSSSASGSTLDPTPDPSTAPDETAPSVDVLGVFHIELR